MHRCRRNRFRRPGSGSRHPPRNSPPSPPKRERAAINPRHLSRVSIGNRAQPAIVSLARRGHREAHEDVMAPEDRNAILSRPTGRCGRALPVTMCERFTMARVALVLLTVLGVCIPFAVSAQDSELVGYTAITRNGAGGILVFNEDCDNAFPGVGAHICTSGDLIRGNLPTRPADPGANATNWIVPSPTGTVVAGTVITLIDQSGKTGTPANFTCDGWASAASTVTGLTANDKGTIVLAACNAARNIACCVPTAP